MFNFVTASFPNSPSEPYRVYRMEYRQRNYEHDFARLYFRDWGMDAKQVKPGTLMSITLDGKELAGYVHDIKVHLDSQKSFTEVSFIGASYVMRQASQEVYKNVTADEVVRQVATKYGFAYKALPHPRVFTQISQAGMTDWELLVRLAKQCGYFLRAEGTSLYFQPLLQDYEEYITESLSFTKVDAGVKDNRPLYSFKPIISETLSHLGADKSATSVAGVDPKTGSYFKYTKPLRSEPTRTIAQPELFDRQATNVVANSYDVAVSAANAIDENSKFPYRGEAEVYGSSKLRPGMPVYLDNVGESYSGYWTILGVEHVVEEESLNLQRFTSRLLVGTDSLGEAASRYPLKPPTIPYRNISPNVRSTRVRPKNVIKSSSMNIKPIKTVSLVKRKNRANATGQTVSAASWKSDQTNLVSKPALRSRSAASLAKVAAYVARQ